MKITKGELPLSHSQCIITCKIHTIPVPGTSIPPPSIHPYFFFLSLFSHLQSFFSALRFLFFFSFSLASSLFSSSFSAAPSLLRLFFLFGLACLGVPLVLAACQISIPRIRFPPSFLPSFFFCLSVESSSKSVYAPCAVWLLISKSTHSLKLCTLRRDLPPVLSPLDSSGIALRPDLQLTDSRALFAVSFTTHHHVYHGSAQARCAASQPYHGLQLRLCFSLPF